MRQIRVLVVMALSDVPKRLRDHPDLSVRWLKGAGDAVGDLLDLPSPHDVAIVDAHLVEVIESAARAKLAVIAIAPDDRSLVTAYAAGADDFIVQPVHVPELVARMHAILRRGVTVLPGSTTMPRASWAGWTMPAGRVTLEAGGVAIHVSPALGRLMRMLIGARGNLVTTEQLVRPFAHTSSPIGSLRANITYLRTVLDRHGLADRVETVLGQGYRLRALSEERRPTG